MRAVFKTFLVLFSTFVREKIVIDEKLRTMDHTFGIQLPNCSKLAVNQKNDNGVVIC